MFLKCDLHIVYKGHCSCMRWQVNNMDVGSAGIGLSPPCPFSCLTTFPHIMIDSAHKCRGGELFAEYNITHFLEKYFYWVVLLAAFIVCYLLLLSWKTILPLASCFKYQYSLESILTFPTSPSLQLPKYAKWVWNFVHSGLTGEHSFRREHIKFWNYWWKRSTTRRSAGALRRSRRGFVGLGVFHRAIKVQPR